MSFEAALTARILPDPATGVACGGRVDWMRRPGAALPAITLQIVSDPRPQHMRGMQRVRPTGVQADVWAARLADAIAIREALIALLVPAATSEGVRFQRSMITAVRPGFTIDEAGTEQQPQGELYRESIDLTFHHDG